MNPSAGTTAAQLVNSLTADELASLIREYGDERFARPIANRIARTRELVPLTTTTQLRELVEQVVPRRFWPKRIHPATRTFQALRIAVNHELESLERGLQAAISILRPGGRLGVISFHSLEDTLVKNALHVAAQNCVCPPQQPHCTCVHRATLFLLTRKVIRPDAAELASNPRSRSARLRVAEKLAATAPSLTFALPQGGAAARSGSPRHRLSPDGRRALPVVSFRPSQTSHHWRSGQCPTSVPRAAPIVAGSGQRRRRRRALRTAGAPPAHPSRRSAHALAVAAGDRHRSGHRHRLRQPDGACHHRDLPGDEVWRRCRSSSSPRTASSAASWRLPDRPSASSRRRRPWACIPPNRWARVVASPAPVIGSPPAEQLTSSEIQQHPAATGGRARR